MSCTWPLATTNIRSIQEKIASLADLIISKIIYILAVTESETWLRPQDLSACIADISSTGYAFHHKPRPVGRGGGVGFVIQNCSKLTPTIISFESMCVNISKSYFTGYFICIYCPPGHQANFFEEFQVQDLLENVATMHTYQNFTLLTSLIFTWIHHLQQLPCLKLPWQRLTQNNMSISQRTYMAVESTY